MTYALNILDLLFTLYAVNNGGVELNPLMASVPFMVFYKVVIVGVLLWWLKKRNVNLLPLTVVYAAVNLWHILNIAKGILFMKNTVCMVTGLAGSLIASLFGGWTASLTTLLIFMLIDYITGLVVAGVFHKSPKTETGALESRAGFKGLIRKLTILFFVLIGYRLDLAVGTGYIRDAVCIAFMANELISIVENAGLMGIPIPTVIIGAIDILKKKHTSADFEKKG